MAKILTATIGVDIGGTNLRLALLDENGGILSRLRMDTAIAEGREAFVRRIVTGIAKLRDEAARIGREIEAIGAGVPGLVSPDGYIHASVNLQPLEGANLSELLGTATGIRTVVMNDANAIAVGEMQCGAGRGMTSMLMVTIGTGVGGGLILNGKLWTGVDGVAGEFGHTTVEPDGRWCPCGNRGCLEQYSSATAIVAAARALREGKEIVFPSGLDKELSTAQGLAELARAGNKPVHELFVTAGRYLGIAIASVVNLLNLEAVVIGGGVAESFDLLYGPIRREIDARAYAIGSRRLKIVKGILGDDAGVIGSAMQTRYFSQNKINCLLV